METSFTLFCFFKTRVTSSVQALLLHLTQAQAPVQLETIREQFKRSAHVEITPVAIIWPKLVSYFGRYSLAVPFPADWVQKAR